eukprot:scaffold8007_cov267-Pinguiococcus_pyrenoidosus.AAC.1
MYLVRVELPGDYLFTTSEQATSLETHLSVFSVWPGSYKEAEKTVKLKKRLHASNDGAGLDTKGEGCPKEGVRGGLELHLSPGEYAIRVEGCGSHSGEYGLRFLVLPQATMPAVPPPPGVVPIAPLEPPSTRSGRSSTPIEREGPDSPSRATGAPGCDERCGLLDESEVHGEADARLQPGEDLLVDLDGAISATASPDGKHVYMVARHDGVVSTFSRNANSGTLTFVGGGKDVRRTHRQRTDGMTGAAHVTVSPDGRHVYMVAFHDDTVSTFSRNASSGTLTFVGMLKDGQRIDWKRVDGLAGAASVAVSPDGRHVYVVAFREDAVSTFSRDPGSGRLTYVGVLKDGQVDKGKVVDGLYRASSITVSPDGKHVYVSGSSDQALSILARDASSGVLTFDGVLRSEGANSDWILDGLEGAASRIANHNGADVLPAVSPDREASESSRSDLEREDPMPEQLDAPRTDAEEAAPVTPSTAGCEQ